MTCTDEASMNADEEVRPDPSIKLPPGWTGDISLAAVHDKCQDIWEAHKGEWTLDVGWSWSRREYCCQSIFQGDWLNPVSCVFFASVPDVSEWITRWFYMVDRRTRGGTL